MAVIGSESCGHKHVARDKNMSDADLRVCCFGDMMRRSNPRIVRTTLNHALACVCFRSAVCFAKQIVFLRVCGEVHVGHSKSATFMSHECEPVSPKVGMRFSTFLLFVLSFVRKSAGQAALQGARHEVLHQTLWSDTSGSHWQFSVGHCPRMSAHGWKLWKRCRVFRAPRMANSSWFSLRQLQNGFAVCTNVQRVCCPLRVFLSICPPHSSANQCL